MTSLSDFVIKYYERLHLDPIQLDNEPTYNKLCQIVEGHITYITFENIAQHGGKGGLQSFDINQTKQRVLYNNRGGFCFELNNLLYELLYHHLHYNNLIRISANVGRPNMNDPTIIEFLGIPTHMFLICHIPNSLSSSTSTHQDNGIIDTTDNDQDKDHGLNDCYIVDVATGEPAIHPLKYIFDIEQRTPDGMISKITKDVEDNDYVILYWYLNNKWVPRLRWKYSDSIISNQDNMNRSIESFQENLNVVHAPTSNFSKKLICTKLSRTHKYTIAGNKYKVTGPPRFAFSTSSSSDKATDDGHHTSNHNNNTNNTVVEPIIIIEELSNTMDVRMKLLNVFGIPLDQTETLDLSNSVDANSTIWSHL